MKLQSLHFRNFRGHADLELPLSDKPCIITGPNGCGKTSVLHGIEFLFGGKNPVGQPHGAGLLREGEKQGWVQGELVTGGAIRRNISPHSLEIEGLQKKATAAAAEQRLMALCGVVTGADVSRAFRPDLFLQLPTKDQGEQWYDILGITVEKSFVATRLAAKGKEKALPVEATYKDVFGPVSANLDAAYKAFFAKRRDKKRDLKEAEVVLEDILAKEADGKAPVFKQAPNKEARAALEQRREELARELGAVTGADARRKQQLARAESLRAKIAESDRGEEWLAKSLAGIATIKAQLESMDAPTQRLARVRQEISSCRDTCCPTCSRPWADAEDRAAKIMLLTQEEDQLKRVCAEESALRSRLAKGEAMVNAQQQVGALRANLADIEADLQTFSRADTTELEMELAQVREKLKALDDQANDAQASTVWIARRSEASDKVTALTATVDTLEVLVELFGPKGLKAEILKAKADPVAEQLSATLSLWGMAARLSTDLVLEVERFDEWRPAYACSDGERILVALALQVWLADHSGTRIILIDRLEALDAENLTVLIAGVEQLLENGSIDHAFLAGVDLDSCPNAITLAQPELLEV